MLLFGVKQVLLQSIGSSFGRVVCLLRRWRGEGLVFICLGFLFETIGTLGDFFLVEWSCMDLASVFKGNREHPSPLGLCQIKKSIYVTSEKKANYRQVSVSNAMLIALL